MTIEARSLYLCFGVHCLSLYGINLFFQLLWQHIRTCTWVL